MPLPATPGPSRPSVIPRKRTRIGRAASLGIPAAVVAVVMMLVVPLPSAVLDVLITLNITFAVLVLLTAMQVRRPLDFSVFPTLLLIATMFRLALNVSATRLVLLHGYAGSVIQSFGGFVVGGSVVVGLVIFLILIVIQFVVITNGAGRVAEVAARFTLDAMPGKQMAIDADLNAGLIDEHQARQRRADIAAEADFYGAMDGASKFVKGDAIAAIVITLVNLIGGLAVGVLQRHLPISQAISTYSLLSVGDGLVSQIPALLLSLSTGIIVTRTATEHDLGTNVLAQLSRQRSVVRLAGAFMAGLALIPGLPKLPFLLVGGAVFIIGTRLPIEPDRSEPEVEAAPVALAPSEDSPEQLAVDLAIEPLALELAVDVIDLVDPTRSGDLLERVRALRRNLAKELGIVIPPVRTRDNLDLPLATYVIRVHGVEAGRGTVPPGRLLAIGDNLDRLSGEATIDAVFGLAAKWIPSELRHQATLSGATVVDRSAVVTTHLAEIARRHAGDLLSRQDTKLLLDSVKVSAPVVVEEVTSSGLSLGEVQAVLRGLLTENIPVRDLVRILEAVSERARASKDADGLLESARLALGPAICATAAHENELSVITLDVADEQVLADSLRPGERGWMLELTAPQAERLTGEIARLAGGVERRGEQPVVVCSTRLRTPLRRLLLASLPRVTVLAAGELDPRVHIQIVGTVTFSAPALV